MSILTKQGLQLIDDSMIKDMAVQPEQK